MRNGWEMEELIGIWEVSYLRFMRWLVILEGSPCETDEAQWGLQVKSTTIRSKITHRVFIDHPSTWMGGFQLKSASAKYPVD